jgi:hypothetical protein
MKSRKLGIELIHHTEADVWYQYISQCTFYDQFNANKFQLTRLEIKQAETEILFEQLDMKEYMRNDDIIYYGCPVIRKVKSASEEYLRHLKKQNENTEMVC